MNKTLWQYFRYFIGQIRYQALTALIMNIVIGLLSGISLVMLIPFLQLVGLTDQGKISGVTRMIETLFQQIHLSLSLESVLIAYVFVIALHAGLVRFQAVLNARILNGFIHDLSVRVYRAVSYAQWQFLLQEKLSDLAQNLSSGIQKVGTGTQQGIQMISGLLLSVIHLGLAFYLSPPLTGLVVLFLCAMLLLLQRYNKASQHLGVSFMESQKGVYSAILELLHGMKTALAFRLEEKFNQEFVAVSTQRTRHVIDFQKIHTYNQFLYQTAAAVAISAFFYVSIRVFDLPLSRLFLLLYIFSRLLPKFSTLHRQYQSLLNMLPMYSELMGLEQRCLAAGRVQKIRSAATPIEFKQEIRLEHVSYRYHSEQSDVLHGVSLTIPVNQMTALTGPSGGGKTTLADMVLGLLTPTEGQIRIDNRVLEKDQMRNWGQKIGYVPQEPFLFHASIRDNMTWVKSDAGEKEMFLALKQASALDFVQKLPHGIDTLVGDKGQRLSGGERQRLCLARALLIKPEILILDEATSHLDTGNEKAIMQAVRQLHGKITLLVIAHRLSTIQEADRVYAVKDGTVTLEREKTLKKRGDAK